MIWLYVLTIHLYGKTIQVDACDALCRRDGYNYGRTIKGNCHCVDDKGKVDDFIHRRVSIPFVGIDEKPQSIIYLRGGED